MTESITTDVHIGEVKRAAEHETLKALLGSCIGIALICRKRQICTLCHCLLPTNPNPSDVISGRWVSQAIPSSLTLLGAGLDQPRSARRHMEAVVAGGSRMVSRAGSGKVEVGRTNREVAVELLRELRIPVIAEDTGGEVGRSLSVSGATLEYEIVHIPRLSA